MDSRPLLSLGKGINPILKVLLVLLIFQRYLINCVGRVPLAFGRWSFWFWLFLGPRW
jgi:hypothetical protein